MYKRRREFIKTAPVHIFGILSLLLVCSQFFSNYRDLGVVLEQQGFGYLPLAIISEVWGILLVSMYALLFVFVSDASNRKYEKYIATLDDEELSDALGLESDAKKDSYDYEAVWRIRETLANRESA
ncbi:MAG: hypothetical protein C9356_20325 [Oleiphilus sp.]|nr:MAG: hypothetical protein C9356_20325 [Oleiphilus sp.]